MSVATVPGGQVVDFSLSVPKDKLDMLEFAVTEYGLESLAQERAFSRGLKVATGVAMLRAALTDEVMKPIMALQGTSLGFRTDKDANQGYPLAVVRDCLIEALMRGALPVGNEFNIIAGRCYLTKEFYTRKLSEMAGLTDFCPMPGVPSMKEGGALVPYSATWTFHGQRGGLARALRTMDDRTQLDERIVVRVNAGMGADAIIGKATRKFYKQIYELLSGIPTPDGEADDGEQPKPLPRTLDALTTRLQETTPVVAADVPQPPDPAEECAAFIRRIEAATTGNEVGAIWDDAQNCPLLTQEQLVEIRAARLQRVKELQAGR